MTTTNFTLETANGSVDYVSVDNGNGTTTIMTKEAFDKLPSNSSIPQAGE